MSVNDGTMRSAGLNLFELDNDAMQNISDILTVLDELSIEEHSERYNTLLDSSRVLVKTISTNIKLNSPSGKFKNAKLYFFNDMFIIGYFKQKKKRKKNKKSSVGTGTGDNFYFGELVGRRDSQRSMASSKKSLELDTKTELENEVQSQIESKPSKSSTTTPLRTAGKTKSRRDKKKSLNSVKSVAVPSLKLKLWMDLSNVDLRRVDQQGTPGVRCSCTVQETFKDKETGELEYSTEVQQVQFFFENEVSRDDVYKQLQSIVDDLLERKIMEGNGGTSTDSVNDTGSVVAETIDDGGTLRSDQVLRVKNKSMLSSKSSMASNGSKKRSYAAGKETMRKMRLNRNKKRSGTLKEGNTMDGITLDDIVSKYKNVLTPENENLAAQFSVTFGKGPMGLALSSIKVNLGVFVSKIESGGMAEASGVTPGDKVLKVDDVVIKDMSWNDVTELIKQKRKECDENGKPKKLVISFARDVTVEENVSKKREEEREQKIKARIKRRGGKREWTKRKEKSFGNRMSSLKDLENRYNMKRDIQEFNMELCDELFEKLIANNQGDSDLEKVAKRCSYILQELFQTEKKYVAQLYNLIDNYVIPLRKMKVDATCKENIERGKYCEHKTVRAKCPHKSAFKKALLSRAEAKALFGIVEMLLKINESLLQSLQKGLSHLIKKSSHNNVEVTVVDVVLVFSPIFSNIMPFFKIYSDYAYQYSNAVEVLSQLKDNRQFYEALQAIESKKGNQKLNALLVAPISRLCKYPLVFGTLTKSMQDYLTELVKVEADSGEVNFSKIEDCVNKLSAANQTVSNIAASVDVKVGFAKDLERLHEIYLELGGHKAVKQFLTPSRKFITKCFVILEDKNVKKPKLKPFWLYLFNDLVIFATEKSSGGGGFFQNRTTSFMRTLGGGASVVDARSALKSDLKSELKSNGKSKSANKGRHSKGRVAGPSLVVKKQLKIEVVNARKQAVSKNDQFAFTLTEVERKTSMVKKSRKNPEAHEQHESMVYRYEVWLPTKEERDDLLDKIKSQVKEHKRNVRDKKRINAILKPELKKRQRQWKNKARMLRHKSLREGTEVNKEAAKKDM